MSFFRTLRSLTRIRGHALSTIGLGPKSIVIDAGAHRGEFSRALAAQFGCRCYVVEANPQLADDLKEDESFAGAVAAALCGRNGSATYFARENPEAGGILINNMPAAAVAEVETLTLPALFERLQLKRADLVKLDVEGSEFELLQQAPKSFLKSIDQISVEFHDFIPSFAGQRLFENVRQRLKTAGFACCVAAFRTHGDVLFLNRRRFAIGALSSMALSLAVRWYLRLFNPKHPLKWTHFGRR
jgi:FkbM family methyltransferase